MSDTNNAITVKNLHKTFRLPHEQHNGIKQLILNFSRQKKGYENQHVLKGISFEIKQGEFFGIVGRNGSGKSTLLKLLAGIYVPDKGEIGINGALTPFIELGVGFNPELTGRENIFLNGALLGFGRKEMESMFDDIVGFAELENFMDQKLKNYSSGMQVRLAFSIAIRANSPILLLDEVLAVGDALFQKKCYEYFKKLKHDKKTVILVSHDTGVLQEYCTSGVLIDNGEIVNKGDINSVISEYIKILNNAEDISESKINSQPISHIGSGRATITSVTVNKDKIGKVITDSDKTVSVIVSHKVNDNIDAPICGLTINDAAGARIIAINNMWSNRKIASQKKGDILNIEWIIPNIFNSGRFFITPAIAAAGGSETLDQVDDMVQFKVNKKQLSNAATNLTYEMRTVK